MNAALDGKSTVVTGASSGIGRASALLFGGAGARLILADRNEAGGEETAAMVRDAGGTAKFVRTDVAAEAEVEAMVAAAVNAYGGLDCAFNNAGITADFSHAADMSLEFWNHTLSINLTGVFLCVKHELRAMMAAGGGSIVNTSSALELVAEEGCIAYAAAKAGVLSVTRCAAIEYATRNVRVNAILPGIINTSILSGAPQAVIDVVRAKHPIGRLGEAHEVGAAALWLLSDAASFVTGSAMAVDGGYMAV